MWIYVVGISFMLFSLQHIWARNHVCQRLRSPRGLGCEITGSKNFSKRQDESDHFTGDGEPVSQARTVSMQWASQRVYTTSHYWTAQVFILLITYEILTHTPAHGSKSLNKLDSGVWFWPAKTYEVQQVYRASAHPTKIYACSIRRVASTHLCRCREHYSRYAAKIAQYSFELSSLRQG